MYTTVSSRAPETKGPDNEGIQRLFESCIVHLTYVNIVKTQTTIHSLIIVSDVLTTESPTYFNL
jgi:hypothetical protein